MNRATKYALTMCLIERSFVTFTAIYSATLTNTDLKILMLLPELQEHRVGIEPLQSLKRSVNILYIAVLQFVIGTEQKICEKQLQKLCGGVNTFLQIVIVCSN